MIVPCDYEVDLGHRLVRVRAWGVLTHAEVSATRQRFVDDPAFNPDFSQIYDLSVVTRLAMTAVQLRELASYSPFAANAKRAFVAPGDAIYGAVRMFEIQHEVSGGQDELFVFRSIGEAEQWLGLGKSK